MATSKKGRQAKTPPQQADPARQGSFVETAMLAILSLDCWKAPNSGQPAVENDYGRSEWCIDREEALFELKEKGITREHGLEAFRRHRIEGRLERQTSLYVYKSSRAVPMEPERVIFSATEKMHLWQLQQAEREQSEDNEDWVLMSRFCTERFPSLKRCRTFLANHPQIRIRKPSKQRLEVNYPDWTRYWAEKDAAVSESLDKTQGAGLPEVVTTDPERVHMFVVEAAKRAKGIRQGTAGQ